MVNSGGWGGASLVERKTDKFPGVLSLDMFAEPPSPGSVNTQAFVEVDGTYTLSPVPADLKLVRVFGGYGRPVEKAVERK